jgi:hypothetical protein
MEWAQAREVLADEYVADVQRDKIAALLVQHQSRTNIVQNGYKQQACVYIISQHKNRPPYKIGMDNGGFARRMANYRTILRHLYVYYAMGFPRAGYNQSSYARAAENFLHWRLRKYRLQFSSFSASTQQWDQGGGNYTELFGKGISLDHIHDAVRDMFKEPVVREWQAQLPNNLRMVYRIAPAWVYRVHPNRVGRLKAFDNYHARRLRAEQSQNKRRKSLKGKSVVFFHNNIKFNVDPDSIDVLQTEALAHKPMAKTKEEEIWIVDGRDDNRLGFDFWPASVVRRISSTLDEVLYFGDDQLDDVYRSTYRPFTKKEYNRLSQEAEPELQAALDLAYEAKFKKAPPK